MKRLLAHGEDNTVPSTQGREAQQLVHNKETVMSTRVTYPTESTPTDQRELVEADRLQRFVGTLTDHALIMIDPHGIVTSWNAGAARLEGYSADEIVGKSFSKFFTEEDVLSGKPASELSTAATLGLVEDDGWRVRKDGTRFWAHVVVTAVRDGEALRGFAKVICDRTERRSEESRALVRPILAAVTTRLCEEVGVINDRLDGILISSGKWYRRLETRLKALEADR